MHLTSAREAKAECASELAGAASEAFDARETVPAAAIGIGGRPPDGLVVAIRLETRTGRVGRAVSNWVDRHAAGEVDVRVIGRVQKLETPPIRQRVRPLVPGASVSLEVGGTGTIGTFVRRAGSEAIHMLSNNHVLANENRAERSAGIIQPGVLDGGTAESDRVGALAAYVPLDVEGVNVVDCAIATVDEEAGWSLAPFAPYGGLTAVYDGADEFPMVAKFGRTTGLTMGTVTAIEVDNLRVRYDAGALRFDDQIEVAGTEQRGFSAAGDSGSLVITADIDADESGASAVGLLFAGSEIGGPGGTGLTYLNPIAMVLSALDVELVFDGGE